MAYDKIKSVADLIGNQWSFEPNGYLEMEDPEFGMRQDYPRAIYNSYDHGVFAPYPGSTLKYNPSARLSSQTQTMARMAIPIPGDPAKFLHETGLETKLAGIADKIIVQGNTQGVGIGYVDFLLQSVNESFSEKVQISDTIGDNYASFFFGMSPPTFTFSGQLLNTFQDDWRMALHLLYQHLLRGTRLARYNKLISLYYDNIIVNGYILNHNQNFTADMQMASSFMFNMLVRSLTFFRLPGTNSTVAGPLPERTQFKTLAGLQRGAVRRTTRVIGEPAYTEASPSSEGGTGSDTSDPMLNVDLRDQGELALVDDVMNPQSIMKTHEPTTRDTKKP